MYQGCNIAVVGIDCNIGCECSCDLQPVAGYATTAITIYAISIAIIVDHNLQTLFVLLTKLLW